MVCDISGLQKRSLVLMNPVKFDKIDLSRSELFGLKPVHWLLNEYSTMIVMIEGCKAYYITALQPVPARWTAAGRQQEGHLVKTMENPFPIISQICASASKVRPWTAAVERCRTTAWYFLANPKRLHEKHGFLSFAIITSSCLWFIFLFFTMLFLLYFVLFVVSFRLLFYFLYFSTFLSICFH